MKAFRDWCIAYVQCLQYQTDQQSDVKKVEKLNNLFFGLMATGVEDSDGELTLLYAHSSLTRKLYNCLALKMTQQHVNLP